MTSPSTIIEGSNEQTHELLAFSDAFLGAYKAQLLLDGKTSDDVKDLTLSLTKQHGEYILKFGGSAANYASSMMPGAVRETGCKVWPTSENYSFASDDLKQMVTLLNGALDQVFQVGAQKPSSGKTVEWQDYATQQHNLNLESIETAINNAFKAELAQEKRTPDIKISLTKNPYQYHFKLEGREAHYVDSMIKKGARETSTGSILPDVNTPYSYWTSRLDKLVEVLNNSLSSENQIDSAKLGIGVNSVTG